MNVENINIPEIKQLSPIFQKKLILAVDLIENNIIDLRNKFSGFLLSLLEKDDFHQFQDLIKDVASADITLNDLIELRENRSSKRFCDERILKCLKEKLKFQFNKECNIYFNILKIKKSLKLTETELEIITILYIIEEQGGYESGFYLSNNPAEKFSDTIARILKKTSSEINRTLNYSSRLQETGLLINLGSKYKLSDLFFDFIVTAEPEETIWSNILELVPLDDIPTDLSTWSIPREELSLFEKLLSAKTPKSYFIDGPPGVGKTSGVLRIAKRIQMSNPNFKLYKLRENEKGGRSSLDFKRCAIAALSCSALNPDMAILIDEAEGVLGSLGLFHSKDKDLKAWINATIERLPLKTIFCVNYKTSICPSTIRRMVLTLSIPQQDFNARVKIISQQLNERGIILNNQKINYLGKLNLNAADLVQGIENTYELGLSGEEFYQTLNTLYTNKLKTYGLIKENQVSLVRNLDANRDIN